MQPQSQLLFLILCQFSISPRSLCADCWSLSLRNHPHVTLLLQQVVAALSRGFSLVSGVLLLSLFFYFPPVSLSLAVQPHSHSSSLSSVELFSASDDIHRFSAQVLYPLTRSELQQHEKCALTRRCRVFTFRPLSGFYRGVQSRVQSCEVKFLPALPPHVTVVITPLIDGVALTPHDWNLVRPLHFLSSHGRVQQHEPIGTAFQPHRRHVE